MRGQGKGQTLRRVNFESSRDQPVGKIKIPEADKWLKWGGLRDTSERKSHSIAKSDSNR